MKSNRFAFVPATAAGLAAAFLCWGTVFAQGGGGGAPRQRVAVPAAPPAAQGGYVAAQPLEEMVAVRSKITRGQPYSAETSTDFLQVLADGNRIVRKTATRVYRDSAGRTRTETIGSDGIVRSVSISDPVAGESWVLDPETRTARRTAGVITFSYSDRAAAVASATISSKIVVAEPQAAHPISGAVPPPPPPPPPPPAAVAGAVRGAAGAGGVVTPVARGGVVIALEAGDATVEDLGQQTIEGVVVNGTRKTKVLPAGAIGNEQPIRVVSEEWVSPELGVLVLTKHTDPRSGDTTFRLTNIIRAEPDPSLFVVPPDYTVKESAIKRELR
ncbi:MAG: hypothetical protein ACE148_08765 [Vicinamibacterales bacterium]